MWGSRAVFDIKLGKIMQRNQEESGEQKDEQGDESNNQLIARFIDFWS
jgi:hypothetical protein